MLVTKPSWSARLSITAPTHDPLAKDTYHFENKGMIFDYAPYDNFLTDRALAELILRTYGYEVTDSIYDTYDGLYALIAEQRFNR